MISVDDDDMMMMIVGDDDLMMILLMMVMMILMMMSMILMMIYTSLSNLAASADVSAGKPLKHCTVPMYHYDSHRMADIVT